VGGTTVALRAAAIANDLANGIGVPTYFLINLGANDVGDASWATITEAGWTVGLTAIVDAMHAKAPNAHIYIMRPWRQGYDARCDSLAAWINDVVTSRSSFCHLGPDERVFLKGADDGATMTADGTHPNHAGYVETAAQWKTALGL